MNCLERCANTVNGIVRAAIIAALCLVPAVCAAHSLEIVPSLGLTKSTDTNAGDAQGFGGVALRVPLLTFLKAEGAIGYRQDSFANDDIKVRQWPVTASLWLSPTPMVYAGGGIGWYRTTTDFRSSVPIQDRTTREMAVHLGGGLGMPLTPQLGLDLNGRYIFMKDQQNALQVPTTFNPDFWTLALGLVIKF